MQLIIFIGIQGAGKSTFYKQNFVDTHIRLNGDMLKTKHRQNVLFNACLHSKTRTIIDKININKQSRQNFIQQAQLQHFEIIAYYFDVELKHAIKRNNQRTGKAKIPEIAIRGAYKRLELPEFDEGFHKIYYVKVLPNRFEVIGKIKENNNNLALNNDYS